MVGSISATAVYVESLPSPPQLMVDRPAPSLNAAGDDDLMVVALAKTVEQMAAVNRQRLLVFFLFFPALFLLFVFPGVVNSLCAVDVCSLQRLQVLFFLPYYFVSVSVPGAFFCF